jgi:hypothetical protein
VLWPLISRYSCHGPLLCSRPSAMKLTLAIDNSRLTSFPNTKHRWIRFYSFQVSRVQRRRPWLTRCVGRSMRLIYL